MHAAVKCLTVLLALLLTLGLPISTSTCSADVSGCANVPVTASCCPSSDCRCRMSAPVTQTPQPANSAVAPSNRVALDSGIIATSLGSTPINVVIPHVSESASVSVALHDAPLYARSHAFLI